MPAKPSNLKLLLTLWSWLAPLAIAAAVHSAMLSSGALSATVRKLALNKVSPATLTLTAFIFAALLVYSAKVKRLPNLPFAILNSLLFSGLIGTYIAFAWWNLTNGSGEDGYFFIGSAAILFTLFGLISTVIANRK